MPCRWEYYPDSKAGRSWKGFITTIEWLSRYLIDGKELLFHNTEDPLQEKDLSDDPAYAGVKKQMRDFMDAKMKSLNDEFKTCTWYRDHWIDGNRNIIAAAKGPFPTD